MYDAEKGWIFKKTMEMMGSIEYRLANYSPILLNVY